MGSGSTGIACKKLGIDFIGIEINEKYFNIAKDAIEKQQQILFGGN
jgi:site-specific DNA-methyltransferase (adenine-specific)